MNFLEELLKQRMAETQAVSTGVMQPDMAAHSSIDNIIGQNQLTMSQMPEPTVVGGGGLGSLVDMMSPMKAATLIPAGSARFMKMMKDLKLSTTFEPSLQRSAVKHFKQMRDTNPTRYAKYKDAPSRDLMDLVLKLDDLVIKSPKQEAAQDARYLLDKQLLRAMKEVKESGMQGTIDPGKEANVKNTFEALMRILNQQ